MMHGRETSDDCMRPCPKPPSVFERRGPRPLALHVAQAEFAWRAENKRQLDSFYRGVHAYRNHPYRRNHHERPVIWEHRGCRLLDYGSEEDGSSEDDWPLLVIPSLINRAYILDLMPNASLLNFLGEHGIRPLLLDWGDGAGSDDSLDLEELILGRAMPALKFVQQATNRPPAVLGYCMGGTLATTLACLAEERMAGLALLATPWNFEPMNQVGGHFALYQHALATVVGLVGGAPTDLLQTLFAQIDPMLVPKKFAQFANLDPTTEAAIRFVAIEDWLNDGLPLSAGIAFECFVDWYGSNAPERGRWRIDGLAINPETLTLPVWLAIPNHDRIVPPESTGSLAAMLRGSQIIRPNSGHVSMVAGLNAGNVLWNPLLGWLKQIAAMQKNGW